MLAALTVIVVDVELELVNVIDPDGLATHPTNVYPGLALVDIAWPVTPELYHVGVEGVVVPAAEGLMANVTWYCVW